MMTVNKKDQMKLGKMVKEVQTLREKCDDSNSVANTSEKEKRLHKAEAHKSWKDKATNAAREMYMYYGFTNAQIAKVLDISEGTVRRINRCFNEINNA